MGLKGGTLMIVSDVLNLVLKNLSREDVFNTTLFDNQSLNEPTDEQKLVFNDLIACLNDVIQSVVYVYHPLKKLENIEVSNEQFDYSKLSETLIDVIKLKDVNGVCAKFTTFPTFFKCKNGKYTITYTYAPKMIEKNSDVIIVPEGKVSDRILATGTTSRFYLKRGMYQDANVWDISFQRLLLVGQRPKHTPKMDARRWF